MPKIKEASSYFFKNSALASSDGDRLDFYYWHPKFDEIDRTLSSTKFQISILKNLVKNPIISGKTPENYIYRMKGIPFIGSRNIRNGYLDLNDLVYIDESIHNGLLKSSKVGKNDVLVTMAGSIGRCVMYADEKESNINQAVARIQTIEEEIKPQYLTYFLNSHLGQIQFDRNKHDVNQPNINTTEIGEIKIIKPPIELQEDIIAKLSIMEKEIDSITKKQSDTLKYYQNIIPSKIKIDTLTREDFYYKDNDGRDDRLDFEWNHPSANKLQEALKRERGIALSDLLDGEIDYGINDYGRTKGKISFINIENLDVDGRIHIEGVRYLDKATPKKLLKEDDILISRSRTVGSCGLVSKKEEEYAFGSYVLRFRVKNEIVKPLYVVSFINSVLGQEQIRYLQTGSRNVEHGGGNNINPDWLKQLIVVSPKTPKEQGELIEEIMNTLNEKERVDEILKKKKEEYSKAFEKMLVS